MASSNPATPINNYALQILEIHGFAGVFLSLVTSSFRGSPGVTYYELSAFSAEAIKNITRVRNYKK